MPRRVPSELADTIQELNALLALIEDWKDRSDTASQSSPRWGFIDKSSNNSIRTLVLPNTGSYN